MKASGGLFDIMRMLLNVAATGFKVACFGWIRPPEGLFISSNKRG